METRRPRALRILPTLAAVMPLPRLLVTPPVTKTYFAMGRGSSGVFLMLQNPGPEGESPHARRRGGRLSAAAAAPADRRRRRPVRFSAVARIPRADRSGPGPRPRGRRRTGAPA